MAVYEESVKHLAEAVKVIPTGSQTFSKSYYSVPLGGAPLFLDKGKGAVVTDIDGNEYIDLVNGLLSISLGYGDEDVDAAITNQLANGITFSLPHKLEMELATKLTKLIPSCEMVRFGKNGSDATSAAIRLARACTGKEHIITCGYHGWHDWYIGSTSRNLGVPNTVKNLTYQFKYNSIESLETQIANLDGNIAAVIMEPMNSEFPKSGFLESVREICTKHSILLIFDEMITGFRFHMGGAQALFDVVPDVSTFGKGMANGMPISAVVGKKEYMKKMEEIFFSGTFGGETLSLAASIATLKKMERINYPELVSSLGKVIADGIENVIHQEKIEWFGLTGHPSWKLYQFKAKTDDENLLYKSVLIQELAKYGILTIGSNNISTSISSEQCQKVVSAFSKVLTKMNKYHKQSSVNELLESELLKPVFKVR